MSLLYHSDYSEIPSLTDPQDACFFFLQELCFFQDQSQPHGYSTLRLHQRASRWLFFGSEGGNHRKMMGNGHGHVMKS